MFKIQFPSVSFGLSEKSQNQYLQSLRATIYIQWQYASFFFYCFCRTEVHTGPKEMTPRVAISLWFDSWAIMHLEVEKPQFLQWAFMVSRSSSTRLESERKKIYTHRLFPISSEIMRWGKIVFLSFQFNVAAGLPRSFAAPVNFAIMSFSKGETDLMTKPEGPRVKEVRVIWGRGEATAQDRLLVLYFEHEGSGGGVCSWQTHTLFHFRAGYHYVVT